MTRKRRRSQRGQQPRPPPPPVPTPPHGLPPWPTTNGILDFQLSQSVLTTLEANSPTPPTTVSDGWKLLCQLALTRIDTLELQLDDLVSEVYTLTEEKTRERRRADTFERERNTSRAENVELKEHNNTLRKQGGDVATATGNTMATTPNSDNLKSELVSLRTEVERKSKQVMTSDMAVGKLQAENTWLRQSGNVLRTELEATKTRLFDAEMVRDSLKARVESDIELPTLKKRLAVVESERDGWKARVETPPQITDLERQLADAEKARNMWEARENTSLRRWTKERGRADLFERQLTEKQTLIQNAVMELRAVQEKLKVAGEQRQAWYFQLRVVINRILEQEPEVTRLSVHRIVEEMAMTDLTTMAQLVQGGAII